MAYLKDLQRKVWILLKFGFRSKSQLLDLLRKTTATNIIKRGGDSEKAGDYLGHVDQNTANQYYTYKSDDYIINIFRSYVAAV